MPPGHFTGDVFHTSPMRGRLQGRPQMDRFYFVAGLGTPWCPPEELEEVAEEREVCNKFVDPNIQTMASDLEVLILILAVNHPSVTLSLPTGVFKSPRRTLESQVRTPSRPPPRDSKKAGYPWLLFREPGPSGPAGFPGPRGPAGMPGYPGPIVMCGRVIKYDFIRRAGQKYFVSFKERSSFSKAVVFCSQQGLQLALPQNEEENNALTQMFGEGDKTAWISINNRKAQGNFAVDLKNQPLVFTKWAEGQPDRSVQDTGCTMLTENGFCTVTQECSLQAYIICQL
ncbi:mannose-binding protein C-like [Sphaeramia orbicularis]|uniref:mannose-binding protein C-like n=1 Tax=Sphaeramia orbicularis TaxID=375764 RepID=UPI001180C886|nr:mannose-binding protein C-like [Sphaeramia orbicularis]